MRTIGFGDILGMCADRLGVQPWLGCGCASRKRALNRIHLPWWGAKQ